MTMQLPDWMADAKCAFSGLDPETWFPERQQAVKAIAKRICQTCPVRQECLDFADQEGYDDGIWGGLDRDERKKLKNTKRPKTHDTVRRDDYKKAS